MSGDRTSSITITILFGACMLLVIGGGAWLVHSLPELEASLSATDLRVVSGCLIDFGLEPTRTTKFVKWRRQTGEDSAEWALLQATGNDIAQFRKALRNYVATSEGRWTLTEPGDVRLDATGAAYASIPPWWQPRDLPDPDVMLLRPADNHDAGLLMITSIERGQIYLMHWRP
jgi:hypothetical protein